MNTHTTPEEAVIEVTGEVLDTMPGTGIAVAGNPYMTLIEKFLDRGGDIDKLSAMLDLKKQWDAQEAEKAFNEAVAAFKLNPPVVYKDKKNAQYDSTYTSIGNMVNTVNQAMAPHGLNASWEVEQAEKNIVVTCVLAHAKGHSKRVTMSGPPDTTGSKNSLQQIKSTVTYLKLATFEAVTGVASREGNLDDDGNGADKAANDENMAKVAEFEVAIMESIDEVGLAKIGKDIATSTLPAKLRTRIRKAYGERLTKLRALEAERTAAAREEAAHIAAGSKP